MTYEKIYEVICEYYKFDIRQKTRKREVTYARFIYFSLCKKNVMCFSLSACARFVNLSHASVLHGINMLENVLLSQDKQLKKDYDILSGFFKNGSDLIKEILELSNEERKDFYTEVWQPYIQAKENIDELI
jgi:hypothetical protein